MFDHVLLPVWVFSTESLEILAANQAAVDWLGYDLEVMRGMTIAELRPESDRLRILDEVRQFSGQTKDAGTWAIIDQAGNHFTAHFSWSRVNFDGVEAVVASIRDMTPVKHIEALSAELQAQNDALRQRAELSAEELSLMLDSLPGKMLVLTPGDYRAIAVTDEYARAVMLERDALIGRRLFDLFPDNPNEPGADGVSNLRYSLQRVEKIRIPDVMDLQRYPVRRPDGVYEERFWLPTNTPVLNSRGDLLYIVHRVEDVTELMASDTIGVTDAVGSGPIVFRELAKARTALFALQDRETRLRTAEILLNLGAWEYDLESRELSWTRQVFELYGIPKHSRAPNFKGYVELVHPDDREQMIATYESFIKGDKPDFEFNHRIVRPNGEIIHVRGVGARHAIDDKNIVVGFVQDVTSIRRAQEDLEREAQRRRFATRLVKLGTWRYDVEVKRLDWDSEVAAIHDEPVGFSPSVDQGIFYYIPEYRDQIRERLNACVESGVPFDEVCQILSAKGRKVWVRAIGEAVRDGPGKIIAVEGAFQDVTDLVIARDEAAGLSEQLRVTLEGMSDAFYLLDADWRFLFINHTAEKLLKRNREELLGLKAWEAFPEAPRTIGARYEQSKAEGRLIRFEEYYPTLETWFEITADPTPQGLAVYFRDITEQRARDEQLRLLEAATTRLNDILLITDAEPLDGPHGPKIVYVNDAFERRTGFTRDEVIGQTPRMLQGPKTQRGELDRIRTALLDWQPVRSELVNYTKSGEEFWLELDIVPLADETGWYTHWVSVERDITDRKRAEQSLLAKEERLRLVTKAAGTAVWEWQAETDQRWWSEGLQEIFGHDPITANTDPLAWLEYVHPDDSSRVETSLQRLAAGQDTVLKEVYRFRRADGTWAMVEDNAFAIRDASGATIRLLGSITDITEKQQLEEKLRQAQKMEVVGQLTGGVSHDFNNLLTIILGNAEILEDELSTHPELQELARMSLGAALRGAELTSQLLAFSRKQPLDPRPIDVATLLAGMDGLIRRTLPENIDVEIVRTGGLWMIEADAAQLESSILNLAVNARDAMPAGGCLTIEMANAALDDDYIAAEPDLKAGQYVLISVTDTGHGIESDNLDRVFEPFFTTKEIGKGSGLGLSMVFGFVKQSGGHIRIYSELGEGTCFKLYFPRSQNDQRPVSAQHSGLNIQGGNEAILVVEDDAAVRAHVSAQLRGLGYRVHEAASGNDALELLQRTPDIDLLFTDVVMPGGMGGRDLAEAAQNLRPGIAVLFTSGYTENSIVHNGMLDSGIRLLSKPYRRQQLAAKIRDALAERKS
jgi:PAS domain S-box-containing protein